MDRWLRSCRYVCLWSEWNSSIGIKLGLGSIAWCALPADSRLEAFAIRRRCMEQAQCRFRSWRCTTVAALVCELLDYLDEDRIVAHSETLLRRVAEIHGHDPIGRDLGIDSSLVLGLLNVFCETLPPPAPPSF